MFSIFPARDSTERGEWIKALEETINSHSKIDKVHAFSVPTEEELNHRMAEAEAYFRILTQQVKVSTLYLVVVCFNCLNIYQVVIPKQLSEKEVL